MTYFAVPNNSQLCHCTYAGVYLIFISSEIIISIKVGVRLNNSYNSHKSRTASYLAMQHI